MQGQKLRDVVKQSVKKTKASGNFFFKGTFKIGYPLRCTRKPTHAPLLNPALSGNTHCKHSWVMADKLRTPKPVNNQIILPRYKTALTETNTRRGRATHLPGLHSSFFLAKQPPFLCFCLSFGVNCTKTVSRQTRLCVWRGSEEWTRGMKNVRKDRWKQL